MKSDEKWIMYDNRKRPRQWLDKHFPKAKIRQKKIMVTVWWSYDWLILLLSLLLLLRGRCTDDAWVDHKKAGLPKDKVQMSAQDSPNMDRLSWTSARHSQSMWCAVSSLLMLST
ncbi:hypothetical protein RI129_009568 [Pyrocoelia pectoralis]|uniref:Uncharacterized protein n=1 Tax=Pyrocoelia pectoralis TaxID=417401 RepID=A0AAN7V8Q6_9COLE